MHECDSGLNSGCIWHFHSLGTLLCSACGTLFSGTCRSWEEIQSLWQHIRAAASAEFNLNENYVELKLCFSDCRRQHLLWERDGLCFATIRPWPDEVRTRWWHLMLQTWQRILTQCFHGRTIDWTADMKTNLEFADHQKRWKMLRGTARD